MADKYKSSFPINIDFTKGEQPTEAKLNALASWARNGLRSFEKLVGDLRGGHSTLPFSFHSGGATGNPEVGIMSGKRAKELQDPFPVPEDEYSAYNQIVSLARLIGPVGVLNPQIPSNEGVTRASQVTGFPLEQANIQALPYRPATTSIDPSDFSGPNASSIFSTPKNNPSSLIEEGDYHVSSEGVLYTFSQVTPGITLKYNYHTVVGDTYLNASPNVIPSPGTFDMQPIGNEQGLMCKILYDTDREIYILVPPQKMVGNESDFNNGIELTSFERIAKRERIANIDKFSAGSIIPDNYYLLWDNVKQRVVHEVKFKKPESGSSFFIQTQDVTGTVGPDQHLEIVAHESFTDLLTSDSGAPLKNNGWGGSGNGLSSTNRYSLICTGTQIAPLLAQLRLNMRKHSHDGFGSERINHKDLLGRHTLNSVNFKRGFLSSDFQGDDHPQYIHRWGLGENRSALINGGYSLGELNWANRNIFKGMQGDLLIGPQNNKTTNSGAGSTNNWSINNINYEDPFSYALIFGSTSVDKNKSSMIYFGNLSYHKDNDFAIASAESFGNFAEALLEGERKFLIFENSNLFIGSTGGERNLPLAITEKRDSNKKLTLRSQRWRNIFESIEGDGMNAFMANASAIINYGFNTGNGNQYNPRLPGVRQVDTPGKEGLPKRFERVALSEYTGPGFNVICGDFTNDELKSTVPTWSGIERFLQGRLPEETSGTSEHPLLATEAQPRNYLQGSNIFLSAYGDFEIIKKISENIRHPFTEEVSVSYTGGMNPAARNQVNGELTVFSEKEFWGPILEYNSKIFELGGNKRYMYKATKPFDRLGIDRIDLSSPEAKELFKILSHHGHISSWNTSRKNIVHSSPEDLGSNIQGVSTIEAFNGIRFSPDEDYSSTYKLECSFDLFSDVENAAVLTGNNNGTYPSSRVYLEYIVKDIFDNRTVYLSGIENNKNGIISETEMDQIHQYSSGVDKLHAYSTLNKLLGNTEFANKGITGPAIVFNSSDGYNNTTVDLETIEKDYKKLFKPVNITYKDLYKNNFRSRFVNVFNELNIDMKMCKWLDAVLRTFVHENNFRTTNEEVLQRELIDSINASLVIDAPAWEFNPQTISFLEEDLSFVGARPGSLNGKVILEGFHSHMLHIPLKPEIEFVEIKPLSHNKNGSYGNALIEQVFYDDIKNYALSKFSKGAAFNNEAIPSLGEFQSFIVPVISFKLKNQNLDELGLPLPGFGDAPATDQNIFEESGLDKIGGDQFLYKLHNSDSHLRGLRIREENILFEIMKRSMIMKYEPDNSVFTNKQISPPRFTVKMDLKLKTNQIRLSETI